MRLIDHWLGHWLDHWRPIVVGGVLVAILCASVAYFRSGISPKTMLACLPPGEGPVLYVDVGLLRKTGILEQIAGKPGGEDADYRQFVEASGFDYRRDLDAALVQWRSGTALIVLKGRFDQARLETYVRNNNGLCARSYCSLAGSVPQRRISFQPLASGMMALSAGTDPMGAATIREGASTPAFVPPAGPVWISLPASSFHGESNLPSGMNVLLESLQGAQLALLTLEIHSDGFNLALRAPCDTTDKAKVIVDRLTGATSSLKDLIVRSGQAPDPASPATTLSAGTFRVEKSAVLGYWPVSRALLEGLGQ